MEEIKANEYIRLENGIILKYGEKQSVKIENNEYTDYSGEYEWSSTVVNHSPEIIDLIEVGDIVNGYPVLEPVKNGNVWWGIDEGLENFKKSFGDIVTILTHEQYEQNCYRLEE